MNTKVFLATHWKGLVRAEGNGQGSWSVESLLAGQQVNCLAHDPFQPGVVYAGTQGNGLLCSSDRGRTWRMAGMEGQIVKSLAVSPHEPGTIYAGTKPAYLFVSRDGGQSWTELEGFRQVPGRWYWFSPAETPFKAYVQAIALSPMDPDKIVAGIEAGAVVRSEDGGRTWTGHCKGADRDCHSMTFHATSGDWIYEAGGGGAAVSRDGGRTWRHPIEGLDGRYCWSCAADPARPEVWYISAAPGFSFSKFAPRAHVDGDAQAHIYRSSGGAPWQKLGGGLPEPLDYMAYSLLTDPEAPGQLYAGLANGDVWHSTDFGDTWRQLPLNLGGIQRAMIML